MPSSTTPADADADDDDDVDENEDDDDAVDMDGNASRAAAGWTEAAAAAAPTRPPHFAPPLPARSDADFCLSTNVRFRRSRRCARESASPDGA
jgi:hypothetical protein